MSRSIKNENQLQFQNMTETVEVVRELKKTAKGKLTYNREKKFEDIYSELQQLICLSVQPSKHSRYEEKKKNTANASSSLIEKAKTTDAHKSSQVPHNNFANCYAEVEQEIIQYEVKRKEYIKKLVANKKKTWEKYEQKFHKESEETIELLKKEDLVNNRESASNCIQVTEEICQNSSDIPEQETGVKTEDLIEKEVLATNENDKRHQLARRDLEAALNELNSNLAEIYRIYSSSHYRTQESDNSLQFLKNASQNIQQMLDSNQQILLSDVQTALSHLSTSKQLHQVLTDIPVFVLEKEPVASSEIDSREDFTTSRNSPKQKEFKENSITKDSSSNNISNLQQEMGVSPCFNFTANNYIHNVTKDSSSNNISDSQQEMGVSPCFNLTANNYTHNVTKDSSSNNISDSQQEMGISPSFNLTANNYTHNVPIHTTPPQIIPPTPHISKPVLTMHTSLDLVDKATELQKSPTQDKLLLPHVTLQPLSTKQEIQCINEKKVELVPEQSLPELGIQNISKKKTEFEEMDSMSSQDDSYNENILDEYVPREAFKKYLTLQIFLQKWKQCYETVISSPEWKKKQLHLLKAINNPINSMSFLSGACLLDKIQTLCDFLSGKTVEVGETIVSLNMAPQAKYFCMDLLAKRLVSQGGTQVASCHENAFLLAATIVHIWQQHPDFGMLFMARIYGKCPYLVPYYIPQEEDQTEEEYHKALGYSCIDGIIEEQPHFLKRMSGIVRLYAAVIQTQPIMRKPHPHGIGYGWMWMANILNLEPRSDITATVLFNFLEVCGYAMYKVYGKQFQKLLLTLSVEFLPKIKNITLSGAGAPLLRLQNFVKEALEKGDISPPNGIIRNDFWKTF